LLRVGLTGGLACGKSEVAKMMAARGAHVIDADAIAHDLMRPGEKVYAKVVKHFGREIVNPDGEINRPRLASAAFADGKVKELNAIVHPAVIARQQQWMDEVGAKDPHAIAVVEAALIVEAGVDGRFDKLVVVSCQAEQKIERYLGRMVSRGGTWAPFDPKTARAEAEKRIAAQLSDQEKIKAADFVIDNSGWIEQTEKQVEKLMQELRTLEAQNSRSQSKAR
jgi:dephospho-CoA kinase